MLTTNDRDVTTVQSDRDDELGGALDRALECHLPSPPYTPCGNYFDGLQVRVYRVVY